MNGLSGLLAWRTSITIPTRLSSEEARERVAPLFHERLDTGSSGSRSELHSEFDAPGRAWVRVTIRCTIRDAGGQRVVGLAFETVPRLRVAVYLLLGFLLLALPVGALDARQAVLFSGAFLGMMTLTHWGAAGIVIKRQAKALSQRVETALAGGTVIHGDA